MGMGLSAGCSVQAAGRRILVFQTVCGSLQRRVQMVHDFSEKIRPGNDLVYDLTEIDTNCQNPRTLREIRIDREFYSCRAVFHAVNGPSIVGSQRLCGEIANRPTINAIQAAMWVSILRTIR